MNQSSSDDVLASLMDSCASITNKCLAYRSLSAPIQQKEADLQFEKELSSWMDRRIMDCTMQLAPPDRAATSDTDNLSNNPKARQRAISHKQQELLDLTVRKQQEILLLKQFAISRSATTNEASSKDPQQLLLQQALQTRIRQTKKALELQRKLDIIRSRRRDAEERCRKLQRENRELKQKLQSKQLSAPTKSEQEEETDDATRKENLILQRVMVDLIAGSGLDISKDKRLQEIMSRITQDC